ncbi:MAG: hypothetical protein VR72_17445 [Clostridiaceae bacterium BRH_c20a]|nr:MAG: hypothetical protein VR72_17445 [Clostridiaceae bacterium BRH_c20a]
MPQVLTIKVKVSHRSYDIKIGNNILADFPHQLNEIVQGRQIIIVSNSIVYGYYGQQVKEGLIAQGFDVLVYLVPDGEEYKTWQEAENILTILLEAGFNRDAVIAALGGGVIGDLAGFAASIYQRGIDLVQLPTTLLAQVDSSVGGKVAVNHPLGKNMIGAFHQPLGVWTDLKALNTLPEREWIAGLAEVVKYGAIWDEEFFAYLEENVQHIKNRDLDVVREIIGRSCQIKAEIVGQDEKEQGIRAMLNFGHTIGHALEKVTEYKIYRHGEAVAIGMVYAAKIAVYIEMCSVQIVEKLEILLRKLGLPVEMPDVSMDLILESLYLDKKVRKKELVFVLPRKIGQVEIIRGITPQTIKDCLDRPRNI